MFVAWKSGQPAAISAHHTCSMTLTALTRKDNILNEYGVFRRHAGPVCLVEEIWMKGAPLRRFNRIFGIPSVNTIMGKGAVDECDPTALGLPGTFGTPGIRLGLQMDIQ